MVGTAPVSRETQNARTRRAVLDAAYSVFQQSGFHGAALADVAGAAGFTKGAVYSRFESKADLFFAVLDDRIDRRLDELAALATGARAFKPASAEQMAFLAEHLHQTVEKHFSWFRLVIEFRTFAARHPDLNARYAEHHTRLRQGFVELIRAAAPRQDAAHAQATARVMMALLNGLVLERLAGQTVDAAVLQRLVTPLLRPARNGGAA